MVTFTSSVDVETASVTVTSKVAVVLAVDDGATNVARCPLGSRSALRSTFGPEV